MLICTPSRTSACLRSAGTPPSPSRSIRLYSSSQSCRLIASCRPTRRHAVDRQVGEEDGDHLEQRVGLRERLLEVELRRALAKLVDEARRVAQLRGALAFAFAARSPRPRRRRATAAAMLARDGGGAGDQAERINSDACRIGAGRRGFAATGSAAQNVAPLDRRRAGARAPRDPARLSTMHVFIPDDDDVWSRALVVDERAAISADEGRMFHAPAGAARACTRRSAPRRTRSTRPSSSSPRRSCAALARRGRARAAGRGLARGGEGARDMCAGAEPPARGGRAAQPAPALLRWRATHVHRRHVHRRQPVPSVCLACRCADARPLHAAAIVTLRARAGATRAAPLPLARPHAARGPVARSLARRAGEGGERGGGRGRG